jgi:hypothetical protein
MESRGTCEASSACPDTRQGSMGVEALGRDFDFLNYCQFEELRHFTTGQFA